jgi:hypothetical protein
MWSLTLRRIGRTGGAEKFRASARNDFFDSICQTEKHSARADVFRSSPKNGHWFSTSVGLKQTVATKLKCPLLCKVKMSLGSF